MTEPTIGKRFFGPNNRAIIIANPEKDAPGLVRYYPSKSIDPDLPEPQTMTRVEFDAFVAEGTFRNYQHSKSGERRIKIRELDDGRIEYMVLETGKIEHAKSGAWRRWRAQAS